MASAGSLPANLQVGFVVLGVLLVLALLGPLLVADPYRQDLPSRLSDPSAAHWLGTDVLGRDMAARLVHGARISLTVGLLAAAFALLLGVPLGAYAGYLGGWPDRLVSRAIETLLCFPTILLVLALLTAAPMWFQKLSDVLRIALVMGLTGWIPVARFLRGEFLKLRDSDQALAARALGCSDLRVVVRHILPSALAPVLVTAAFTVGGAISMEAALSFLGLGMAPPTATWGSLLSEARENQEWWLVLFPGSMLFLAVLGCNLVGEGLRDVLDPHGPESHS